MNKAVRTVAALALVAALMATSGCAPLVVGGAVVGGALVATDRRPVGIQLEDQAIEVRVGRAIGARFQQDETSVNVTSYNRRVLLTGEVPTEALRAEVERLAAAQENVRAVANEIHVGAASTFANRNNDLAISARVLAAMLREADIPTASLIVHTSRSRVFLMGRVTEAEAAAAARSASRTDGVRQVVKLFEVMSDDEWRAMRSQPAPVESPRR